MKFSYSIIKLLLCGAALVACQQNKSEPSPGPTVPTQGIPTEVGKPVAEPVKKIIGPAGGTISTPDQIFSLVIPPGALTKDTTIIIQPVENKAWSGTGPGYMLSPKNLELAKPAILTWNYQESDVAGSTPEALGVAFQQDDHSWQGRNDIIVDKTQKKVTTHINKLTSTAFYESYYLVPAHKSLVPGEHVDLKVFFHAGHEDASELAPLTMPEQLGKEQLKNWKINGHDTSGPTDPMYGVLAATGNGASATYVAPGLIPRPSQIAISVDVVLKAKAQLILIANLDIEAANAFQFAGARVDSAQIGAIAVAGDEYFQVSLSERDLTDQKQAAISLSMLPFPGVGAYQVTDNGTVHVSGIDRERKSWSDSYQPRGGKKVIGPMTVSILEYDKANKRVKGKISGTLHYYDDRTNQHKSTQLTARFYAASPY